MFRRRLTACCLALAATLTAAVVGATSLATSPQIALRPVPAPIPEALPPLPPPGPLDVQLVLDDDTSEVAVGVSQGGFGRQYLWFNRFQAPAEGFDLEQVWVLFPVDPELAPGLAVELAVYHDADGDPANGATVLAAVAETIQFADGITFSVYDLVPPVAVPAGGDVLIGVINRFVTSGVSAVSFPSALDDGTSQTRSWIATWIADPPDPPALPSDGTMVLIDSFPGLAGNWMIRGLGSIQPAASEIPVLGLPALLVLAAALAGLGLRRLRGARHEVAP